MAVHRVGSLLGSPATRARPWCGRNRGPSCAFVRRYVQTPVVRPYTSKKPASLCSVLAVPVFLPFKHARNARARLVPKSRGRRVAAGAAFIEMRRIKRYFRLLAARAPGHSRHARAPGGRGQPFERRTELFKAVRRPLPARWAAPSVQPSLWPPWRAAGIQLPGRAARDSTRRKTPPPPSKNFCCV